MVNPTIPALVCRIDKLVSKINSLEQSVIGLQSMIDATPTFHVGETTLVLGTQNVVDPLVHADSLIMLSRHTGGGTVGNLSYMAGEGGFTVNSSSGLDASVVVYQVFN